jgi:FkbM family methyltransferase
VSGQGATDSHLAGANHLAGSIHTRQRAIFPPEQERKLIHDFFAGSVAPFFVDVGAADPEFGSQTWDLEQAGWSGIVVEPRPDMAQKLRRDRRAAVYEMACSSPVNVGRTMTLHLRGGYSSLNDSLMIAGLPPQGTIIVAVNTLDAILAEAKAPTPIDFVSIDVEGHETDVLDGFDLAYWRPRLILIEDHVLDLRLHHLLQKRGYKWVRRSGLNGWYVPADDPMQVSWIGWLQFLRKYYLSMPTRRVRDAVRRARAAMGILPPSRGRD